MKQIITIVALLLTILVGIFIVSPSKEERIPLGAANQVVVEVLGGGGGGGVVNASGGGGGGGGEYRSATCTVAVASYTVTVGVGGTADNTGETDSTFTDGSTITITADGGNGSANASAGSAGTGGSTTGCTAIANFDGGTPGAGNTTGDVGGGGGGGAGYAGKGGNGASATANVAGGGGGGAGETAAGGDASGSTAGTGGSGGGGNGGAGGSGNGSDGTPATYRIVGGGGGGGGTNGTGGGTCGAPGAGSGGGEATGAGNGCRGEIRITYVDSQIDATGGTETTSGIYRTHTFTTSGTFTVNSGQASPLVVMDSPSDGGSISDSTPDLSFTGTSSSTDPIRYNVQVDTAITFGDSSVLNDGTTTGYSQLYGGSGVSQELGQSITTPSGIDMLLDRIELSLQKTGSPTDGLYVEVRSGSFSGTVVATSNTVNQSSVGSSEGYISFSFASESLTQNTQYFFVLIRTGARSTSDYSSWHIYNGYADGTSAKNNSGTWSENVYDYKFKLYGISQPLINVVSGTDAGFSGTPDNTDPFTSAQQVTYTVQSALSDGTYYWRVRGIDPDGTNLYGDWAKPGYRSFILSTGGGGGQTTNYQSEFFFQ